MNKLANMSGVTQSTVNNIVNGRNNSSTVSTIKKLCDGLGMSLADFFNADCFNNLEQALRYRLQANQKRRRRREKSPVPPVFYFICR